LDKPSVHCTVRHFTAIAPIDNYRVVLSVPALVSDIALQKIQVAMPGGFVNNSCEQVGFIVCAQAAVRRQQIAASPAGNCERAIGDLE
jgi:hypothetical protein